MLNFVDEWERVLTNKDKTIPKKPILFVYAITFDDNSVYVGMTKNPKTRYRSHLKKSSNLETRKRIGLIGHTFKVIYELFSEDEKMMENNAVIDFKLKGYSVLNVQTITSKPTYRRKACTGLK